MAARQQGVDMAQTATESVALVRAGYETFARGDIAGLAELFHPDATWDHHNSGRLGGTKVGFDSIAAFFGESAELTAGTLRAEPIRFMSDGAEDIVAVLVRTTGQRPDGRQLDDIQVHLYKLRGRRIEMVDQFIGDPPTVEAFWA